MQSDYDKSVYVLSGLQASAAYGGRYYWTPDKIKIAREHEPCQLTVRIVNEDHDSSRYDWRVKVAEDYDKPDFVVRILNPRALPKEFQRR